MSDSSNKSSDVSRIEVFHNFIDSESLGNVKWLQLEIDLEFLYKGLPDIKPKSRFVLDKPSNLES